jgi:Ca-activated chloride channel homolog
MTRGLARLAAVLGVSAALASGVRPHAHQLDPRIRITSPLGRAGLPGTIRIVARVDGWTQERPIPVNFYVDKLFLSSDTDGPPYDALWTDENPFEKRELIAEAELASGAKVRDVLDLKPLEVEEAADVRSVAVEATVLDDKGHFIKDLTAENFAVRENGTEQKLDLVMQNRDPALFALLVDASQSMAIRSDDVRSAAARLIAPLGKDDQILVAPFSRTITSVTGPTTDRATVLEAIRAIRHSGGTAILDALGEAARSLATLPRRKAIVLITDGYDEHSESKFEQTTETLRSNGITTYVIGFGGIAGISLKGEKLLARLADDTGGRAWFPRDERQLLAAYDAIATEVQHKYLITYTPQDQNRDGTWRTIDVSVPGSTFRVRARKGYTAPVAPPIRASLEFTGVGTGSVAPVITRDDIIVLEDGEPQEIDVFQEAVLPVTFMLALDSSGSMKRSAAQAQEAAREFIAAMRLEDQLGLMLFGNKPNAVHAPTERRDASLKAIDEYVADGGTALYDALYDSLEQLASVKNGRRVVVVVTDGRDENAASDGPGSLRTWDEVLAKLQQTEAAVYAVGIGSRVERDRLQQLADRSGGAAYFPTDVTTLASDYHRILDELRRRYIVGYLSTNRSRNGRWRAVEIRARQKDVAIRSRGGYYAPAQ